MGRLTRQYDWSTTSLGTPDQWPLSLRTTLGLMLHSAFPTFLFWGEELLCFYNDAYRPSLGNEGKHPLIGKRGQDAWPESWHFIGPLIEQVLTTGEAVWFEDQVLPIYRNGRLEDAYWTFSYSPAFDDSGAINGVFVACTETTKAMQNTRQLEESEQRFRIMAESSDVLIAVGDETSNATYFNKAWVRLTGRPMEDLLRFGWVDLVHSEDKGRYVDIYLDAFKITGPFTGEFRVLSQEGDYRWLLAKGTPRFSSDGVFLGYISSCVDITENISQQIVLKNLNEELVVGNKELTAANEELAQTQKRLQVLYEAVAASEAKFRSIIDQAPVAIAIFDGAEFVIETYNEKVLEYWGRTAEEVAGKPLFQALPESSGQGFEELLTYVLKTGERYVASELPVTLLRNGVLETTWINFIYDPIRDLTGEITGIIVVCNEVTEQVNARRELEQAYEQVRLSKEAAQLGTFDMDLEKGTLVWDERCRTLFGISHNDTVSYEHDFASGLHPDDRERILAVIENVYVKSISNGDYDVEYRTIGVEDKKVRWVRAKGKAYFDKDDKPVRFIGSVLEITDQVNALKMVEESEQNLRDMVLQAPIGICVLNATDLVAEIVNDSFVEIAGKPYEAIVGKHFWIPFAETKLYYEEALQRVVDEGNAFYANEVELMLIKHGREEVIYATFVYAPLKDIAGQVKKVVVWVLENTYQVTERRRIEVIVAERTQELAAANQELVKTNQLLNRSNDDLQKFAYVASHDLQEPLRKIQSFGDLLKGRYNGTTGEESTYIERMQSAASRMSTLIRDLLDFSRVSTQHEMRSSVSLNEVVDRALTTLELVIAETKAEVIVQPMPTVMGDALQLDQLFQNLLSNALKFRQPGQTPMIQVNACLIEERQLPPKVRPAQVTQAYHQIDVVDNGVGFDEKYLDRIFQVFQRLYGKNEFAGTGIGLAICEKVVANHGGAITAASQPGQGATFRVYLPAY